MMYQENPNAAHENMHNTQLNASSFPTVQMERDRKEALFEELFENYIAQEMDCPRPVSDWEDPYAPSVLIPARNPSPASGEGKPESALIEPMNCFAPVEESTPAPAAAASVGYGLDVQDKCTPLETARKLSASAQFIYINRNLYVYDQNYYHPLDEFTLSRLIAEKCHREVQMDGRPRFVRDVIQSLQLILSIPCIGDDYVCTHIPFRNGLLDPISGALLPHTPAEKNTYCLSCSYTGYTFCPNFEAFLFHVTGGNPGLIQRMWEMIGYCLSPDMSARSIFLLQGEPGTGKTLFCNFLCSFFPEETVATMNIEDLGRQFGLSALVGKHICTVPDMPDEPLSARTVSTLKKVTGNDYINSDVKYSQAVQFHGKAQWILTSNHPLVVRSNEPALTDRLVVIPFGYPVPRQERDRDLARKFIPEMDSIASRAVQAYCALARRGYRYSGEVESGIFLQAQNPVFGNANQHRADIRQFLLENYHADPEGRVYSGDAYRNFCSRMYTLSMPEFSGIYHQMLSELGWCKGSGRARIDGSNSLAYSTGFARNADEPTVI